MIRLILDDGYTNGLLHVYNLVCLLLLIAAIILYCDVYVHTTYHQRVWHKMHAKAGINLTAQLVN